MMSYKSLLKLALIVLFVVCGTTKEGVAGENKWTLFRQKVFNDTLSILVVDPSNPEILYASRADTGILKSEDGGISWHLKGLQKRIIQKITIDPFRPNIVYACTDAGLYKSEDRGNNWLTINFWADSIVNSVALVERSADTLYAAIDANIYKSRDGGNTWGLIPDTIHATIRALVVSRVNPQELYVGTDAGVYKVRDDQEKIVVIEDPNKKSRQRLSPIHKQKTIDLVVDRFHTQVIFALFEGPIENSGVYWAHEDRWVWRDMNQQFEKEQEFPLLSLSLDPNRPRTLYATNKTGNIFLYEFTFPQIGILDFKSSTLPAWELARFSQSLAKELNKVYTVKWFSKREINTIDSQLIDLDKKETAMNLGRKFGLEYVISGIMEPVPNQDSITIIPAVTFVAKDSQTVFDNDRPLPAHRYDYFPSATDSLANWFYMTIHAPQRTWQLDTVNPPRVVKRKSFRKAIYFGALLSVGIGYTLRTFFEKGADTDSTESRNKLPLPPRFP